MELKVHLLLLLLLLLVLSGETGVSLDVQLDSAHNLRGGRNHSDTGPTKLFAFGDSYADTGNMRKIRNASSWLQPYGMTFPGKPAGRFSDGLVLTDYIAKYVGLKSPIPYRWRRFFPQRTKYGMNFACGGTGVFSAYSLEPNMTTQIDYFEKLIQDSVYTAQDLSSSLALVSLAGNDYNSYVLRNGSPDQVAMALLIRVIEQLVANIKRIHALGVGKILVTGLEPIGCLPASTAASSFQECNQVWNSFVRYHNAQFSNMIDKSNQETSSRSTFFVLDLYDAFMHTLEEKFQKMYKPCCLGLKNGSSCGKVDAKGNKEYYVCQKPDSAFFWDSVHPTQAGWRAVSEKLLETLQRICPIKA